MKSKYQTTSRAIGSFVVTSGKLVVSDPCYTTLPDDDGEDRGSNEQLVNVANGDWYTVIDTYDFGKDGGERIVGFWCNHDSTMEFEPTDNDEWLEDLCVDSGQLGVFCASVYDEDGAKKGDHSDPGTFYGSCCAATSHSGRAATVKGGAVVRSGFGDGEYLGHVLRNPDGQICSVFVMFIDVEEFYKSEMN